MLGALALLRPKFFSSCRRCCRRWRGRARRPLAHLRHQLNRAEAQHIFLRIQEAPHHRPQSVGLASGNSASVISRLPGCASQIAVVLHRHERPIELDPKHFLTLHNRPQYLRPSHVQVVEPRNQVAMCQNHLRTCVGIRRVGGSDRRQAVRVQQGGNESGIQARCTYWRTWSAARRLVQRLPSWRRPPRRSAR